MSRLILFNKPYGVLCQFTGEPGRETLAGYIPVPGVYAAGRLDTDSEGLLVLTGDGALQARIADPRHKLAKTYLVQVEGKIDEAALDQLGLEFSIAATFIALITPVVRSVPTVVCVAVSLLSVVLFSYWQCESAIVLAGLAGMTTGYLCKRLGGLLA